MKIHLNLINIFFILIGAFIFSFGIVNFNMTNELTEGGFTGIALILYHLFGTSPALMNLIFNIPLFFVGYKLLGRLSFIYTLTGTLSVSLFLWLCERYPMHIDLKEDLLLASLFGGVFIGVGLGIIFRFGGTTGGVDILARLMKKYFDIAMGRTMFAFDCLVLIATYITIGDYIITMYTLVCVFVGARVIDIIQDSGYSARGALIISERHKEISDEINSLLDRGVTIISAHGHYSQTERPIIYCVVPRNEITRLKQIIHSIDPHAFVSLLDVHDVLGEGFTLDEFKKPIER
ncbi:MULTISPECIES: YitT family protein [Macrococcus]|uniref:YitT family protein n=1 Tax=Macrococcus psychrotolerans TaxID=3039389 RepID=A0AAU6R6T5_9STAP|nr:MULTISPECIES: YitT family protein [Macrococcus]MDJ1111838.1 YitT family protein [Macrococcus sp. S115]QYA31877.1 YitT family protein [Macrococcus sp. 19Msa1099]QYA36683.1 YitT family protein [Macrococcus caseolyticus]QYA75391.1 YitT family protein [Macrococcus caseolyticus]